MNREIRYQINDNMKTILKIFRKIKCDYF